MADTLATRGQGTWNRQTELRVAKLEKSVSLIPTNVLSSSSSSSAGVPSGDLAVYVKTSTSYDQTYNAAAQYVNADASPLTYVNSTGRIKITCGAQLWGSNGAKIGVSFYSDQIPALLTTMNSPFYGIFKQFNQTTDEAFGASYSVILNVSPGPSEMLIWFALDTTAGPNAHAHVEYANLMIESV